MKKNLLNYFLPCVLLFALAFFLKLKYITYRDVCGDEPFSIFLAQAPLSEIYKVQVTGNNPPLWEWLLHFWQLVFGTKAAYMRLLPLLIGAATAPAIWLVGRRFYGVYAAWFMALLFVFSNLHFYFGLEARVYALLCLLTALAFGFYLSVCHRQEKWALVPLLLTNILLVYAHYFGWLLVAMQVFTTVLLYRKSLVKIALVVLATVVAYAPIWWAMAKNLQTAAKNGTWLLPPYRFQYFLELEQFLNHRIAFVAFFVLFLVCVVGFFTQKTLRFSHDAKLHITALLWFFVPYTAMFLVSFWVPVFLNRYILFCSVPLYIFLAGFCVHSFSAVKMRMAVAAVGVLAMGAFFKPNPYLILTRQVQQVTRAIAPQLQDPQTMVLVHPFWAGLGLSYYLAPTAFADYNHHEARLHEQRIHPVWELTAAQHWLTTQPKSKVLYFQDGNQKNVEIERYLHQNYQLTDSSYFRDNLYLYAYKPK